MIRHAVFKDVSAILPLLEELGYPCALQNLEERFTIFCKHPGYGVAVYEREERIVGFIAWSKSYLFVLDKVRFHIEALAVSENSRGIGIGKKLILFVEGIASEHSPVIVDLTSSLWREEATKAHSFYSRLGYNNKKHSAYFRKEL